RSSVNVSGDLLLYLAAVVGVATAGGTWPGIGAAIAADLLANWYFIPPVHTLTIGAAENVIAVVVFLGVAAVVSWLVGYASRRSAEAARARSEAAALVRLAGALLSEQDPLVELMGQLRTTFGLVGVSLLHRDGSGGWRPVSVAGDPAPTNPDQA